MRRLLITNLSHMRRSDCNLPLSGNLNDEEDCQQVNKTSIWKGNSSGNWIFYRDTRVEVYIYIYSAHGVVSNIDIVRCNSFYKILQTLKTSICS